MNKFLVAKSVFSCVLLASCAFSIASKNKLDINVGFPQGVHTVPLTPDCICPQEVFGAPGDPVVTTIWYGAAVEPSIAVNPKNPCHIVAAWQQDRIDNGGALEAGIAYSNDGGNTWQQTVVPFQICTQGITQRISDPWLSYAADGCTVYLIVLAFNSTEVPNTTKQNNVVVSVSHDNGATWGAPAFLETSFLYTNEPTQQFAFPDKTAITADPNCVNRAYAVWDDFNPSSNFDGSLNFHSFTTLSITENKGKTWSMPLSMYDPFPDLALAGLSNGIFNNALTIGNVIVVLPKCKGGTLVNFMNRTYAKPGATNDEYLNDSFPLQFTAADFAIVRSFDHGKHWESTATIISPLTPNAIVFTGGYNIVAGQIQNGIGTQMRTGDVVPSGAVNPKNGNLYGVWQTSQFSPITNQLPQIAISTSRDGGTTWSQAVRASQTPLNAPNPQAFTPFVAVTSNGFVGVLYSDFRFDTTSNSPQTPTDTWLAIFKEVDDPNGGDTGIGLNFVREVRLSQQSYIAQNGPETTQGVMTNGDYSFLVAQKDKFYAIYTKSFNGPFTPAIEFCNDPINNAIVNVDDNYRQAPFVSIVHAH